ncbi:MAG: hypothetical protein CM1200mP38_4420 [Dehalococcoidia bacterium]|nr:MAG: hypothetical protein CM1200mP38_4420 [Dehalococcoidia bacterium]
MLLILFCIKWASLLGRRFIKESGLSPTIFSDITTEPTVASVNSAVEMYRENQCDLLIAIGGGARLIALKRFHFVRK